MLHKHLNKHSNNGNLKFGDGRRVRFLQKFVIPKLALTMY